MPTLTWLVTRQLNRRPTTTVTNTAFGLLVPTHCAGCLTVRIHSFALLSIGFHGCYLTPGSSPNSFFRRALYNSLRCSFACPNPFVVPSRTSHSDSNTHVSSNPSASVNTTSNDSETTNVPLRIVYCTPHLPEALRNVITEKQKFPPIVHHNPVMIKNRLIHI